MWIGLRLILIITKVCFDLFLAQKTRQRLFMNSRPDEALIYDVGAHKGEDTEYYLRKGFRVIAIEAMPEFCEFHHQPAFGIRQVARPNRPQSRNFQCAREHQVLCR